MKLSELPDVYRASLDEATFDTYLEDLRALDSPLEVRAKAAATAYAEERTWTLDKAVGALEAGAVRAVQVRYVLDGQVWCDTIMGAGRAVPRQLVRMAALVAALLLCASGEAGAQSPSASPTDATAAPAEGDAVGAGDAEATAQEDVAPVPEEQSAPSEPPPEAPAAPAAWPFDWGLDAFTRPEVRTGYDELGLADNDFVRFRFRFALILTPIELGRVRLSARIEPQASGAWSSGADLTDAALGLHQGFITIATDRVSVQLGRQELNYGEHLVLGSVPWHPMGRAFDAAKVRVDLGSGAWLDVFGAQLVEGATNNFADTDAYLLGAYAALGPLLHEGLALDVYLLEQLRAAASSGGIPGTPGLQRSTLGVRARQRIGLFDYRAEAGVQLGRTGAAKLRAFQFDAEAGVTLAQDHLRLALEGFYASGDDPGTAKNEAWDQLYPTAHIWLGFADIIGGRSNVAGAVFHAAVNANAELRFTLDTHLFVRPEAGALSGDGLAGFEADVGARWQIGTGLALRANYSLFRAFTDAYPVDELAHFAELELRYTR
ncbi:MAG: alginate export family protein [Polyangiales bacterium]|nr:alginate export family protein [Myxococcales bacterium]MCB9660984.1 alginate export family protein [Sandaracinaceae bacterium]